MNLTTDSWIPIVWKIGQAGRVSLCEAFERGEEIRDLAVRPHERIALMRLLICIAQAVLDGPADEDDWKACYSRIVPSALDYLRELGFERPAEHERALLAYATQQIEKIPGVRIIGTAREKAGVLSFVIEGVHPHDAGTLLDQEGIAVRTGHHCAQPVMERFGVPATTRASFAFYNTREEVDALVRGIHRVKEMFA